MGMRMLLLTTSLLLLTWALSGCGDKQPANIILIIGDGMDEQQLTIARNYLAGSQGKLIVDSLPALSTVRVQTVAADQPDHYRYVADSANTATTLATGVVTSEGRISRDASGERSIPTLLERARSAGYRTGIVTTASVTDATPAAFASHSVHRKCQGPADLIRPTHWYLRPIDCTGETIDRGGRGSIANQLLHAGLDILLGGGRDTFAQAAYGGEDNPMASASARGFQLVSSVEELDAAALDQPLLGLFAPKNLPVRMLGRNGRKAEAVALAQDQPQLAGEIFDCVDNPAAHATPTLKAMTDKALALLGSDPQRGLVLMIESASIDKQSHARQPCGHIGEVQQLEQALQSALDFSRSHPRTLILVTADHGHAAQLVPDQDQFVYGGQRIHSPGRVARVKTPEGSVMMINYATGNLFETHTGTNVPLFASGPGAHTLPSYLTQADVFRLMADFLGL
jgi:alkaline phosphatase